MKNNIIGLKEFRNNVGAYTRKIDAGQSFIIVKKSKPVFKISPVDEDEVWETIIDFTGIKKGGVIIEDIISRL